MECSTFLEEIERELQKVLEEQKIENDNLEYFYRNIPESMKKFPLSKLSQNIVREIVWELNSKFGNNEYKWKEFAEMIGIADRRILNEIAGTAHALYELPLYIAITRMENQKNTFENLINALLEKKFLDVLLKIKPYVDEELSKASLNIEKGSILLYPGRNSHSISIILLYLERDILVAHQVSELLRNKHRMRVTTLLDLKDLSADYFGVLNAELKKADFTVPIISKSFIRAIDPRVDPNQLSPEESKIQYVFKWEQESYLRNGFLNFRVKPLMVPDFLKRTLPNDLLLSSARILWKEFPNFIQLLKNSKKSVRNFETNLGY